MPPTKIQQGFTLIEVLIAAVILFAVVASVSQVYQGAVTASLRASRAVEVSAVVPLLADTISFRIKQANATTELAEQGVFNDYVFNWSATVIKRSPPAPRFDLETDSYVVGAEKFYLWQVELQLSRDNFRQDYQFTVLSWKGL